MLAQLRRHARIILNPHSEWRYIHELPQRARVLDIGCGNDSAQNTKSIKPRVYYVGVDVQQCGSGRNALAGFRRLGFGGPRSEPDVRLSPHPALHVFMPKAATV